MTELDMLDVGDRLVEQVGDMVIVKVVDDVRPSRRLTTNPRGRKSRS